MKKVFYTCLLLCLAIFSLAQTTEREYDYMFFENSLLPGSYFNSAVTYNDGCYIKNIKGKLPISEKIFFTPPNSLEMSYTNGDGKWEANVLFERLRGNDFFKKSSHLSFWLYSENTDSTVLPLVSLCREKKQRNALVRLSDDRSDLISIKNYFTSDVKDGWRFVKIPLRDFAGFEGSPNKIIFSNSSVKGAGTIFIDQLELFPDVLESTVQSPGEISAKAYELHVDLTWDQVENPNVKYLKIYRSEDNKNFKAVGIQRTYFNRYTDYTGESNKTYYYKVSYIDYRYKETATSNTVKATTRKFKDEELLDMVQEASFRYYWEGAEPSSGLALENIPGRKNMIATGASGFGIMAIIVGAERGFITRDEAVNRMIKIVGFLKNCDKYHGALSHFMDGSTGKTVPYFGERDNGGDLVETSFLFQGLLAARSYFNKSSNEETEIRRLITTLWESVEWNWYDKEKDGNFLTWHWSGNYGWSMNHKLIGWNETMITYILAMASPTNSIPLSMYYKGWASQKEQAVKYRKSWGKTDDGSFYTNGNCYYGIKLSVGVSCGGPLFFVHYSYMGLDPNQLTDSYANYFDNNKNIALINFRYCSENPKNFKGMGDTFWGLTASDGPWGYKAIEPKIESDNGTLAPTGSLASFPYTPEQSMAALKNMYRGHGRYLWGEYGFRDAVNLEENWQARIFMGLNQAPVTVMIENYRTGLIWNLFMKNSEIKEVVEKLKNYRNN